MRKRIKSLFSLLLVGVVLFSVCSSNQFGCAKALDSNSRGTVTIYQQGAYVGQYYVRFYDGNNNLISRSDKRLSVWFSKDFTIPESACSVSIDVYSINMLGFIYNGPTAGASYYANLEHVSPYDRIEFIGIGTMWEVGCTCTATEGWQEL
jgi:hypothetical protein